MIRAAVSGATRTGPPLSTLLAVWNLTPASAATSLIETYRRAIVPTELNERSLNVEICGPIGQDPTVVFVISGADTTDRTHGITMRRPRRPNVRSPPRWETRSPRGGGADDHGADDHGGGGL